MTAGVETEHAGLATSRALVYGVLASLHSRPAGAPELEVLSRWCEIEGDLASELFPGVAGRGLESIRTWLAQAEVAESLSQRAASLESEFTALFRGLRRGASPPPPYESVYMDGGQVFGPSTDSVGKAYSDYGLVCRDKEPPDHLALELDFMRFLCEGEAKAWDNGEQPQDWLEAEHSFMAGHLDLWVGAFCENLRKWSWTGFYSGLADITEGWISGDQDVIAGLAGIERDDMVIQ